MSIDKPLILNDYLNQYRHILNDDINSHTNIFNNYKESVNQVYKDNIDVINQQFELLAQPYREILKEKFDKEEVYAWDFTIFKIIKSKRPEEHIHSPLLLELLNTQGTHGQKDLFYKLFLKTILPENQIQKYINDNPTEYTIEGEEWIKSEAGKGKIDISIKSNNPKKKFAIIIENKWKSPDSCIDQLYKYYKSFTDNYNYNDENLLLVYLTLHGKDPDTRYVKSTEFKNLIENNKNRNYFPISYKKHISKWLTICSEQCKSDKVKQLIIQYLNSINMESIIDDKIFELSTKKENFELVCDLNQRFDSIIERLKKEFWQELFNYLKTSISNLVVKFHEDDWYITLQDKRWDYFKLYLEWGEDDKINYGIYTDGLKYKKVKALINQDLSKSEMLTDFEPDSNEDFICYYIKYNYDFTKLSGLKRLLPETRIELFHEFAKSLEKLYEQINLELLEMEKKITNHR